MLLASALGLAVAAHAAVDGCVDPGSSLLALGLCSPSAWIVTRTEPTLGVLLAWLAAVQVGVHLVLTAICGGPVLVHSVTMLGAHLGAVTITAVLLRGGDASLWAAAVARRVCRYALVLLRPHAVPVLELPRRVRPAAEGAPVRAAWRCPSPVRRGPPVGAAAS